MKIKFIFISNLCMNINGINALNGHETAYQEGLGSTCLSSRKKSALGPAMMCSIVFRSEAYLHIGPVPMYC